MSAQKKEYYTLDTMYSDENEKPSRDRRLYTLREEVPETAVLKLGVPLIAGMFIMAFYNLVDTWFIGLLQNDYQLAAVSLGYPVMMILIAVSNIIGTGSSSLIARSLGAEDIPAAVHTLTAGFVLTLLNSLMVTLIGLLFLHPLVTALGAKEHTFLYTADYVSVLLSGSFFIMGSYTFGQLLRSEGAVKRSVTAMAAGTLANIILDPLFIFVLHMEVRGAAIATVLGNALSALLCISFYLRHLTILRPDRRYLIPSPAILKEIYWVGIPAALETLLTSAAYIITNNLAVSFAELTVAAMGTAQKILSLGSYIYQGFAAGTQPIMGFNFSARNYRRMIDVLRAGLKIVTLTELAVMVLFGLSAPQLIGLFSENPEVIHTGSTALRALMFILPTAGATSMSRMSFQAMGKPQYAFLITVIRQLVLCIPLLLILSRLSGFRGLICAQPLSEAIMMAFSVSLLIHTIHQASRAEK